MIKTPRMASDKNGEALNIAGYHRHIIFCGGDSCCQSKFGEKLWDHLKSRLKELGMTNKGTAQVFRTKAKCLRVCADGPIAVVYPEGTWYRLLNQDALDEVIDQHLVHGKPVERYAFASNSMCRSQS